MENVVYNVLQRVVLTNIGVSKGTGIQTFQSAPYFPCCIETVKGESD